MSDATQHHDALGERLMRLVWLKPPATLAERTRRRIVVHLLPVLFVLYILAYLDRVNVSVAQLRMTKSPSEGGLSFDNSIFGFGAGLFFWGYWILEIPSTLSVLRWGARWVFCRILVLWGLCAVVVGFIGLPFVAHLFGWLPVLSESWPGLGSAAHYVNNLATSPKYQFYFFRFWLGFFEGGFFPSVIVYLSLWFRTEDRSKAIACFMSAIPLSSALGLPLSGKLLDVHWLNLDGWRWVFILEGLAPVLAGFAVLFFLPDRPEKAKWLPADERQWLLGELDREHAAKRGAGHGAWLHHLGIVGLLTFVYFCLNVTSYGLSMFLPAIIKSQLPPEKQSGESDFYVTLLAAVFYFVALAAMLVNGRHSDRTGERIWHVTVPLIFSGLGIGLVSLVDGVPILPVVLMIFIVGACMYTHLPAFWPIPTLFLGSSAAASAIGFINMVGNLGGYFGPNLVGKTTKDMTSFAPALMKLAPWPLAAAAVVLGIGYWRRAHSAARERLE